MIITSNIENNKIITSAKKNVIIKVKVTFCYV